MEENGAGIHEGGNWKVRIEVGWTYTQRAKQRRY